MPIYPPRNEPVRKIEILEKRIIELKKCIRLNAFEEKLVNKAEKVREAQLNLIRARLFLLKPYSSELKFEAKEKTTKKLEKEYINWEGKLVELIIEEFQ